MIHYHVKKPTLWKTVGTVICICFVGLFICVYLLFSGFYKHAEQLERTEDELQQTRFQLEQTKIERSTLQQKIDVLERLEHERGTLPPPPIREN